MTGAANEVESVGVVGHGQVGSGRCRESDVHGSHSALDAKRS